MSIYKEYEVEDENTIRVLYLIKVSSGDKNDNIVLYSSIEHNITIGEDLAKISEFEKEAELREKELKEKAMKLTDMIKKLKSMGYKRVEDEGD